MSTTAQEVPAKRAAAARTAKVNPLGLEKNDYKGRPSTLCKGCGHDSVSQRIMNEVWELGLDQAFTTAICLVEWPDRLGQSTPDDPIRVWLDHADDGRTAQISFQGRARLAAALKDFSNG